MYMYGIICAIKFRHVITFFKRKCLKMGIEKDSAFEDFFEEETENRAIECSKPVFTGKDILEMLRDKTLIKKNINYNANSFYPSGRKDLTSRKYSIIDSLKFQLFFDLNKFGLSKTNSIKVLNDFKRYQPISEEVKGIEYIVLGCFFETLIDKENILTMDNKEKFFFLIDDKFRASPIYEDSIHDFFIQHALEKPLILIPFFSHYMEIISYIDLLIMTFQLGDCNKFFSKELMHVLLEVY